MYLALALGFGILAVAFILVSTSIVARARRVRRRVEALATLNHAVDASPVREALEEKETPLGRLLHPFTAPIEVAFPEQARRRIREKLASAGVLNSLSETEFIFFRILSALAGLGGGTGFYLLVSAKKPQLAVAGGILLALLGAFMPDLWLQGRLKQRQQRIRKTLSDALDLLVVSVEAGTGFDGALRHVKERFPGPMSEEFDRVLQEMRLGKPRTDALRDMAARTGVEDVSVFVSAVCQADQLGVGMAQMLRAQSQSLRGRRIMQIKETAQKLPVKLLFPLVFCIFPAIFVAIVGPGLIRIYEQLAR
jgi:tight adherence protein C